MDASSNAVALAVIPDRALWPESGTAASPHDPVEIEKDGWFWWGEALGRMTEGMRDALTDWAPPYTWFEVEGSNGAVLMTPAFYPRQGMVWHGQILPAVGMMVFVKVGDWWFAVGHTLVGRTWVGLTRSCQRPVPLMAYMGEQSAAEQAGGWVN